MGFMRACVMVSAVSFAALSPRDAGASAIRYSLNKSNQPTAPLKFSVLLRATGATFDVHLAVPRSQPQLDFLWRVDVLWRTQAGGTLLDVPVRTTLDHGDLTVDFNADAATLYSLEIWIRCGEHAPLAETIYAVEVGSFK
jgi:hypothetical protein